MTFDCVRNSIGRMVPRELPGLGALVPFSGAYSRLDGNYVWTPRAFTHRVPASSANKVAPDLKEAIRRSGLENGMKREPCVKRASFLEAMPPAR